MEQKYHPILEHPWEYSVSELHWGTTDDTFEKIYYLDVTFTKNEIIIRLRFLNPQQVRIELSGKMPQGCGEMIILDIQDRGWEGMNVEVAEGGASGSPITLYAREVIDLDSMS